MSIVTWIFSFGNRWHWRKGDPRLRLTSLVFSGRTAQVPALNTKQVFCPVVTAAKHIKVHVVF
jgi:hypothetical protein